MNFIFISPNYPAGHWKYVAALRNIGAQVLCIGDAGYDSLRPELRGNLTEYYRVDDLHDYDSVYRACAFFIHKYGRIDAIASLNPYWLDLEARLREEYHIPGLSTDKLASIIDRKRMLEYAGRAGIPAAAYESLKAVKGAQVFAEKNGYPVVVRPVSDKTLPTFYITGEAGLEVQIRGKLRKGYMLCACPQGKTITVDGLAGSDNRVILAAAHAYATAPEKVEDEGGLLAFHTIENDDKLIAMTARLLETFALGATFFHLQFVKLESAVAGLGKKGDYVLLDISFAPPAQCVIDSLGYSTGISVSEVWAKTALGMEVEVDAISRQCVVGVATRRFSRSYKNAHEKVLRRLGADLCEHGLTAPGEQALLGDYIYIFKGETQAQIGRSIRFIQEDFASAQSKTAKAVPKKEALAKKAAKGRKKS